MVPKIPEFRKRGRSGEHAVASILCTFSNIMVPEYDIGLDFYCELFENNSHSGRFWVQVKTTYHFEGEFWGEYIDKDTVRLWLKQVVPVYILVFEQSTEQCYWISVQEHRREWIQKLSDKNDNIQVIVDKKHVLQRNEKNREFVEQIKHDFILIDAIQGNAHMIGDGYVQSIPILVLSEPAITNLRGKIRLGLDYLINDLIIKNNLQGAYTLLRLLAEFDRGHYDHFLVLARVCRALGKIGEARDNYNVAIGICKDDPNWNKLKRPEDVPIEEIIKGIEKELPALKTKRD